MMLQLNEMKCISMKVDSHFTVVSICNYETYQGENNDDEQAMNLGIDSFKEVLNVTCGQVLTAIAGEKALFNLSIPEVSELGASGWTEILNKTDTIGFLVNEYPMLLFFSFNE